MKHRILDIIDTSTQLQIIQTLCSVDNNRVMLPTVVLLFNFPALICLKQTQFFLLFYRRK